MPPSTLMLTANAVMRSITSSLCRYALTRFLGCAKLDYEARVERRLWLAGSRKIRDRVAHERSLAEHAHVLELRRDRVVQGIVVE